MCQKGYKECLVFFQLNQSPSLQRNIICNILPLYMPKSKKSIYSALAANVLIAITKFIAGSISNSSAMIAEGVHSVVDTINELLLLYGIRLSKKPADALRPFGYGKELYFWSFIVALLIFGLGGGISIYQGYQHIRHPEPLGDPTWSYAVLLISIVFEGSSFIIAWKEFNKQHTEETMWSAIHRSKDPTSFTVLFEDGAAVIGLLVVLIAVYFGHRYQLPYLDGIATVTVGLLLVTVSLILARESRSLLMGEGIAPDTKARITALIESDPHVKKVLHILSTYQSPEEIVLMIVVAFRDNLDTSDINEAIERIRDKIRKEYELVRYILVQPKFYEQPVDKLKID
jgi:cation diffusion facilitator family transporter